jgi:Flp pilus assembly pilin Flp
MRYAGNRLVRHSISRFARLRQREDGQSLAEYAMILSFVMVVCVAVMTQLGQIVIPFFGGLDSVF